MTLVCRKCGKHFPSSELVQKRVLDRAHIQISGSTPITTFDGVVSPCCWALWNEVNKPERTKNYCSLNLNTE